jgi:hypothetical protein
MSSLVSEHDDLFERSTRTVCSMRRMGATAGMEATPALATWLQPCDVKKMGSKYDMWLQTRIGAMLGSAFFPFTWM